MDRKLNLDRAETFSFVNPWIRYFLFFFSFLFWVSRVATIKVLCRPGRQYTLNILENANHQQSESFQRRQICYEEKPKKKRYINNKWRKEIQLLSGVKNSRSTQLLPISHLVQLHMSTLIACIHHCSNALVTNKSSTDSY